jgi:hypothetical protein
LWDDSAVEKEAGNSPPNLDEGCLDGWEEIASFLGRGIRTVQRWEKEAGLPVRRLFRQRRSLVHAYRQELTQWIKGREEPLSLASYRTPESKPDGDPNRSPHRDVLTGWKEVAAFLGRSVRTVQRWEKDVGLPVRRLKSKAGSIPYSLRSELSAWLSECGIPARLGEEGGVSVPPPSLLQTFIDGFGANIAVLDVTGTVVAVNRAWKEFDASHGYRDTNFGLGKVYSDLVRSADWGGATAASAATAAIIEVQSGARPECQVKYLVKRTAKKRWFSFRVTRFSFRGSAFLVVAHHDITELVES